MARFSKPADALCTTDHGDITNFNKYNYNVFKNVKYK